MGVVNQLFDYCIVNRIQYIKIYKLRHDIKFIYADVPEGSFWSRVIFNIR